MRSSGGSAGRGGGEELGVQNPELGVGIVPGGVRGGVAKGLCGALDGGESEGWRPRLVG